MTTREVVLDGGSPWGFRLHGGADVRQPLRISRVNPGSKAALRGIREGDFISSINSRSTKDLSNAEAHTLLRNSGDTLKLGLNENYYGSPKRRQYKTVHQETHSETVRRSSVTSYTLTSSKTISQTSNDGKTSKVVNGNTTKDYNPGEPSCYPINSAVSTPSSNSSTYTETGADHQPPQTVQEEGIMPDNAKTRRKRSRNQRKKGKPPIVPQIKPEEAHSSTKEEYRVDSPKTVKSPERPKMPGKSKSLDDDDVVKIQELSEVSEGEDKTETKAVVVEAESDIDLDKELETPPPLSLPLQRNYVTEEITIISPEEELTLRNFLEGLNLVNSPQDAAKQVLETSTIESIRARKAKKRAALEQYFLPIVQNPRFLDVINEETSDLSDKEQLPATRHLKQGTPELDVPQSPKVSRKRIPRNQQKYNSAPISNPMILVGTKIVDSPSVIKEVCNTNAPEASSQAELVFLEDSSDSTTPDPKSDPEDDKEVSSANSSVPEFKESEDVEEQHEILEENVLSSLSTFILEPTLAERNILLNYPNTKEGESTKPKRNTESVEVKQELCPTLQNTPEEKIDSSSQTKIEPNVSERNIVLNLASTKVAESSETKKECETVQEKQEVYVKIKQDKSPTLERTSVIKVPQESTLPNLVQRTTQLNSSCPKQFESIDTKQQVYISVKKNDVLVSESNTIEKQSSQMGLEFELTPPPTPDNISPKNEVVDQIVSATLMPFISLASSYVANRNFESLREISRDSTYHLFPSDLRSKIDNLLYPDTKGITLPETHCFNIATPYSTLNLGSSSEKNTKLEEIVFDDTKTIRKEEVFSSSSTKTFTKEIIERFNSETKHVTKESETNKSSSRIIGPPLLQIIKKEVETKPTTEKDNKETIISSSKTPETSKIPIPPIRKNINKGVDTKKSTENVINSNKATSSSKLNEESSKITDSPLLQIIKKEAETNNNSLTSNKPQENSSKIPIPPQRKIVKKELQSDANEFVGNAINQTEQESMKKVENKEEASKILSPPPPSPSPSSSGSSSRSTSLSTARYFPTTASLTDIAAIAKDEELLKLLKLDLPLPTLRELCILYLMNQPFGSAVLQELAEVSFSLENLTNTVPSPNSVPAFMIRGEVQTNNNSIDDSGPQMPASSCRGSSWVGLPTERDPTLLLCLSPTQKDQLEKSRRVEDEAGKLLELHEKYLNRARTEENLQSDHNRLLEIIREEPRGVKEMTPEGARLQAKDLNEWLNLARYKNNPPRRAADPRRASLPHQEYYERQMLQLLEKEREIQHELEHLEDEKRKLSAEMAPSRQFHADDYHISPRGDFAETKKSRPVSLPSEFFRQRMYEEYMDQIAAREERKQLKVIKVTSTPGGQETSSAPAGIGDEFMDKVKQKQQLGKLIPKKENSEPKENFDEEVEPVLVMDRDSLKGAKELPKHLREFIDMTKRAEYIPDDLADGVWSPGQKFDFPPSEQQSHHQENNTQNDPMSPVWTPKSATSSPTVERKEFRPIKFESPVLGRKNYRSENSINHTNTENSLKNPPWKVPETSSETGVTLSSTLDKRLPNSQSSPASGFNDFSTSRLPKAQNPTITLLQKAREGQLPKGALYIDQDQRQFNDRAPLVSQGEILYKIKNEYTSESDSEKPRKMADLGPRKFEGIGPTTRDGMPLILRSEVKDANQSKWYKKMYDTIHKQRPHRDEYVTVRYKQRRGQYPYSSGYLSEPEPGAYDSDYTDYKYATLDRRRVPLKDKENDYSMSSTMPRNTSEHKAPSDIVKHGHDSYKNQPRSIANYTPGRSSISEKEAKEWWDEVMDIFDGHLEQQKRVPQTKSFINQALKESGYESDSTLVFRRRDDTAAQLSPREQKEAYKVIQKGGEVPLHGLRRAAPERPKEDTEFFPISPTLPKHIVPQREILCYPVTIHPHPSTIFANYKRTAPSPVPNIPIPPPMPPSPPRRRSSRNNSTLRLISTMKVKTSEKSPICRRHETCFTTSSNINNTNVKYLRDKITCKLSTGSRGRDGSRVKVSKVITSSPDSKSKLVSSVSSSSKVPSRSTSRNYEKASVASSRSQSTGSIKKPLKKTTVPKSESVDRGSKSTSSARTFGMEKKRIDIVLPKVKSDKRYTLVSSPELLSPNEVKKAVQSQEKYIPSGTVFRRSSAMLSSARNSPLPARKDTTIPIKVGISERGKTVLKTAIQKPSEVSKSRPKSLSPINIRSYERHTRPVNNKKIIVSTIGRVAPSKTIKLKPKITSNEEKKLKKSKKESINGNIAKNSIASDRRVKCAGRASGATITKRLRQMSDDNSEFGSNLTLEDIQKQREAIQTDYFFQNLFLRHLPSPTPSMMSNPNSWLLEKTYQLQNRSSSHSEPTVNAMKVYLKHTKPVTDSKFRSLDFALARSRSASPKSVTFNNNFLSQPEKRSSSLPPKIVLSQTSRPVSPKVERRYIKSPTPPPSPKIIRSPSSRRIMNLKNLPPTIEKVRPALSRESTDLTLYSCPSLAQSTSSIDSSYDRKEYQTYVKELVRSSKKSSRFKDLNDFYATIEKFGELEQATSALNLKPRRKFEDEIIDYDRWQEVRKRERAEKELKTLVTQLKEDEKEKGFLFCPKELNNYRWKRELDRGLRIKEKSVDNIKEEFERLKSEEHKSEALLNDSYKPLWRGDSVLSLANKMTERRSHSEGRTYNAPSQKLMDNERLFSHRIGSRLWSSLSSEQVNILKNQLSEIYGQNANKPEEEEDQYSIHVPSERTYHPTLTIRRNSDISDCTYKSEDTRTLTETDKKSLSKSLSKEILNHITLRKQQDVALPLVLAKETRGATAAAEASDSMAKSCPAEFYLQNRQRELSLEQPSKALVKTDATTPPKLSSTSETESTDESTRTVIYTDQKDEIKKKVEYFEKVTDDIYSPTVYKPSDQEDFEPGNLKRSVHSNSYQDLKEFFGEQELMKFATVPLSATRKEIYSSPERPQLRRTTMRVPSPPISEATSIDSLYRSRSLSPFLGETLALARTGEVRRLKNKFESPKLRRSTSDPNVHNQIWIPGRDWGDVEILRSRYEFPAIAGRGRNRTRRGGVVSPTFLKAEDRFMPHINIISKIANLYTKKTPKEQQKSVEELANYLGCPVGEVEKIRKKFEDYGRNISLLGHMFTSSPNIRELRDIAPYLAASWMAHRYPKSEDNTRSLSSPESSPSSRDTSRVRRDRPRPKSMSPPRLPKKSSILKHYSNDGKDKRWDAKNQPLYRYQPEPVRYKQWWPATHTRPSVSFKEPEAPPPPPKGLHGVRNLPPPESPRKYVENEVTIHYKTPVRQEIKEYLSEDELAYRQAEAMKKIYQEERRRKYLQELQDMNSRRHTDNFIPSQKSPISLNRYDDFEDLSPNVKTQPRSPEPRLLARALYNFVGQTARELTFRKGDLIYVRRQVDKNWYEGELNAMVGLFPVNYIEIVTYDTTKSTPRKSHEGQARAKYNFLAHTHLELSLAKGELVVVTRKVDDNWYEGKIGGRKGIFPVSYVDLLIDPTEPVPSSAKPVAAPAAHSLLLNGSSGGKDSMGSHSYTPSLPSQLTTSYHAKPVQVTTGNYGSLSRTAKNPVSQALHIETQSEPIPYRALYKYLPQNDDELELLEGDTVYVLEKCDDGWYVGSSDRTGAFGTFPGNYVEKI